MKAYVLINVQVGTIPEVIRNLTRLPGVQSADMTFGEYDMVAVVQVPDVKTLARLISMEIQPIPGVIRTNTCMAVSLTD